MKRALLIFLLCFGMIFENTGTAFAGEAEAATGIETETDKETKTETDTEPGGSEEKIDISSAILTELVENRGRYIQSSG